MNITRALELDLYRWNNAQERAKASYYGEQSRVPFADRKPRAQNGLTHCRRNHPFDEKNTYVHPDGWRTCRTCKRASDAKARAKNRSKSK